MKKLLVLVVLSCLLAVLGATAAVLSPPSASGSLAKVVASTTDAQSVIDQGKISLQGHNIIAARDKFALAVAADPANQEANLLYGVTRVFAILENQSATSAGLDSVREIFELSGFSFQSFGLYGIEGTHPNEVAATTPRTGAVLDFVKAKVLPELDAALANLAKVTSPSFSSTIAPAAIAASGGDIAVDYADALVIKALLNAVKCNLNLLVVYGPDVSVPDIAAAPDQLLTYKQLFADANFLTPREPTRLGTARSALINFIDTYKLALPLLNGRSGAAHHLFVVDAPVTNEPVDASAQGLTDIADVLDEVRASLDGAHQFPGSGPAQDRTVDLSKFFNAANPLSIRAALTDCSSGTALPDPTLMGLFPLGLSGQQELASRYGSQILGVACSNRVAPLIQVRSDYLYFGDYNGTVAGPRTVTVANNGTGPLHVSAVGFGGDDAADFSVDRGSCGSLTPVLDPGTSCGLTVNMRRPPTHYGNLSAVFLVNSDDPSNASASVSVGGYQQAPPGGTISGKVRDAVTNAGIQATVQFYDAGGWQLGSVSTDSSGAYAKSGLPSGYYKIAAYPSDSAYVSQWYFKKTQQYQADTVALTTLPLQIADFQMVKGGSISGFVRDATTRAGVPYVSVQLYDSQGDSQIAWSSTASDGSYSFQGVVGGSYRVKFPSGGSYTAQWYKGGAAVAVTPPGNTALDDALLTKGATISGRVTDVTTHAGIEQVWVNVSDSQSGEFVSSAGTDSTGAYSVTGLPSGSYKVHFEGNGSRHVSVWYGNAASESQATLVTVTAPGTRTGIDAALAQGGSISGRVTDQSGDPISNLSVDAGGRDDDYRGATTDQDGNYTVYGLAPGSYELQFDGSYRGFVGQYYNNTYYRDEAVPVQVTGSNDTGGINAVLTRGGRISGRVTDASGAPIANVDLEIFDINDNDLYYANTDASGYYQARGLPTGSYKIRFEGYDSGNWVSAFYGGASQLSEAALVPVTAPMLTPEINVTLVPGGSIAGTVTNSTGTPAAHAYVHVFDLNGTYISGAEGDAAGNYKVPGIPAGTFKLFFEGDDQHSAGQWYSGKASFATATTVTVAALADKTGINAQLGTGPRIVSTTMVADFGRVVTNSTSSFRILDIINLGSSNLVLGTATLSGANAGEFLLQNDSCSGKTLVSGDRCSVRVRFSPSSQAAKSAVVNIPSNDPGVPVLTVAAKGTGVAGLLASTMTTLTSSVNPSLSGQSVGFTATVSRVGSGSATPAGSVTFKDGAAVLGTVTLNASGQVTLVTAALSAGSHTITAQYAGSSSFNASSSAGFTQTVNPPQRVLTVVTAGSGSGSVNSNPSGIACSSGTSPGCSAGFPGNSTVTLLPSAASYSAFSGWSGACTGTGSCQILMDAAKSATATFTANPATVRIDGRSNYYYSLDGALDAIGTQGQTVRARAQSFVENVIMTSPVAIKLRGGFTDGAFSARTVGSFTVLDGSLKIRQGTLKIERLLIR